MCERVDGVDAWVKHGMRAFLLALAAIVMAMAVGAVLTAEAMYCTLRALLHSHLSPVTCLSYWRLGAIVLLGAFSAMTLISLSMDWLLSRDQA